MATNTAWHSAANGDRKPRNRLLLITFTLPSWSLTITPKPIRPGVLSDAASQLAFAQPYTGAYHFDSTGALSTARDRSPADMWDATHWDLSRCL
ncbi:hypothetical protein FH972_019286 [Carpinus fangiana]|uniref:Uncharacterized protein n=1 Tax=Carpinus fangiana TaxID=176857 RepID=A0A5N6RU14_9ROSI|nr:hypothetical protein FH972_019286 [Carpinus fangiana]